jgi:hypothetical protein
MYGIVGRMKDLTGNSDIFPSTYQVNVVNSSLAYIAKRGFFYLID